jgi:Ni/Co efflux regulator RcnB
MSRLNHFVPLALALLLVGAPALSEEQHEQHPGGARPAARAPAQPPEPHPGPQGYQRPAEPQGWNNRPASIDRGAYQHNYQAARSFKIGPYHPPRGWVQRHWGFGEILPRAYWAAQYLIADYWLFALEVPPAGYEWVRGGTDAILVNTVTGEILQVESGVFA